MKKLLTALLLASLIVPLAAFDMPKNARTVIVDDYHIQVAPQSGNSWLAWGGEEGRDGVFIPYRQKRAIEVQSKCRVRDILSNPGETLLRATVHQCRG